MPSRNREIKERLFARYLSDFTTFSAANPLAIAEFALEVATDERIPCPLCLKLCTIDQMTVDHCPPKSVGGRPVALTCKECNSNAGHQSDHAVIKWLKSLRVRVDPLHMPALNVEMVIDDPSVTNSPFTVTFQGTGDGNFRLLIPEKANDMRAFDAVQRWLTQQDSLSLNLEVEAIPPSVISQPLCRAAYLLAYSRFGYAFACRWQPSERAAFIEWLNTSISFDRRTGGVLLVREESYPVLDFTDSYVFYSPEDGGRFCAVMPLIHKATAGLPRFVRHTAVIFPFLDDLVRDPREFATGTVDVHIRIPAQPSGTTGT